MTTKKTNYFTELNCLDVTKHVEKKGRFSYLSWAHAVRELKNLHPTATWEIHEYEGVPFMKTECGYFVKVTVIVNDVEMTQVHPVLDNYNKSIEMPNAFEINTSIQRCLVKAIALKHCRTSRFSFLVKMVIRQRLSILLKLQGNT
jgi:hypothetical protein